MKHLDKNSLKHFGVNFLLSAIGGWYGVSAGAGASLTKEYCDKQSYGHWCWVDLVVDVLGMAAGVGVNYLIKGLL